MYHKVFQALKFNQSLKELALGLGGVDMCMYHFFMFLFCYIHLNFLNLFYFMQIHLFAVPNDMVEDCFSENSTLEEEHNTDKKTKLIRWFALRNEVCNSLGGVGKAQRNSVPQSLELEEDIQAFLKELMSGSKDLRTMKLIVLGDGRIGKTTLLNAMKAVLEPDHHQVTFLF
jgi:hypothetical protein